MDTPEAIDGLRRALDRGDVAGCEAALAPYAVLHVPGRTGLSGPYRGRVAVLGFVDKLARMTGESFRFHSERTVVDGDLAMVLGRATCTRHGRPRGAAAVLVATLAAGRISEILVFHHDQPGLDQLCE